MYSKIFCKRKLESQNGNRILTPNTGLLHRINTIYIFCGLFKFLNSFLKRTHL